MSDRDEKAPQQHQPTSEWSPPEEKPDLIVVEEVREDGWKPCLRSGGTGMILGTAAGAIIGNIRVSTAG
jgi:hypothetical protein